MGGAVDIKLDYGLDGTTTLQLQCRLPGTTDFFNEMPYGRCFNFATIVPSGWYFSRCCCVDSCGIELAAINAVIQSTQGLS